MIRHVSWKITGAVLVLYSLIMGFIGDVPRLPVLNETIRNLYFHVPMWFTMIALMAGNLIGGIRYLSREKPSSDWQARNAAQAGLFFATLGLITGMLWARFTWGAFWVNDPKLNGTAVTMLLYLAYFVLRSSVEDPQKKGRLSAVYSIFAFVMMIVFIGILPRLTDSLHPGNGGNPAFGQYDLNNQMRLVFYPAALGWILIGYWLFDLKNRLSKLEYAA